MPRGAGLILVGNEQACWEVNAVDPKIEGTLYHTLKESVNGAPSLTNTKGWSSRVSTAVGRGGARQERVRGTRERK